MVRVVRQVGCLKCLVESGMDVKVHSFVIVRNQRKQFCEFFSQKLKSSLTRSKLVEKIMFENGCRQRRFSLKTNMWEISSPAEK